MTRPPSAERWAIDISLVLNAVLGSERFPVDVTTLAREFTAQRYPDDPVTLVKGKDLPGFDGALIRAPGGKKGWGIFYNSSISSVGRISFTLAHELGHYLLHRVDHPSGFRCGEQDVARWDTEYARLEQQANAFAANLLMPLDDYRRQIDARAPADLDMISACAERYRVSLVAAVLRWIGYTHRRAVLVVSRDGYILWSRASDAALKSGAFFRTSQGPVEVPPASVAGREDGGATGRLGVEIPPGVWFNEEVREMTVFAGQYDFVVSLLLLNDEVRHLYPEENAELDVFDRVVLDSR